MEVACLCSSRTGGPFGSGLPCRSGEIPGPASQEAVVPKACNSRAIIAKSFRG